MNMEISKQPSLLLSIVMKIMKELGYNFGNESVFLDFGCGSGKLVRELCDLGYQAYGCGTRFLYEDNTGTEAMMRQNVIRPIDLNNYRLPFEDNTFDFVFSDSVFEHVQNYSESISEIARVLKPDGYCLHFFASRYVLIEPHIFVPFATIIQTNFWLYLWAVLGIRNEWTVSLKAKETSAWFYNYLREETNYLTKKQLLNHFGAHFNEVRFCEDLMLKHSPRKRKYLYSLSKILPFIPAMWSTFRSRVILTRSPKKGS